MVTSVFIVQYSDTDRTICFTLLPHLSIKAAAEVMIKRLDKNMRNQFTVIRRRGDKEYGEGMAFWFETR